MWYSVSACGSSASRPSITTPPPAWCTTGASSPPRRRSASRASARSPLPGRARSRICLQQAGIEPRDLDVRRLLRQAAAQVRAALVDLRGVAPRGLRSFWRAMPLWLKQKLWIPDLIRKELPGFDKQILFPEHHESHAASAFYPVAVRRGGHPHRRRRRRVDDHVARRRARQHARADAGDALPAFARPALLGVHLLHRLQGQLAASTRSWASRPTASRSYADLIYDKLIDLRDDGSFRLDLEYFDYCAGLTMTNERLRRAVRRAAARARVAARRSARWISRRRCRW